MRKETHSFLSVLVALSLSLSALPLQASQLPIDWADTGDWTEISIFHNTFELSYGIFLEERDLEEKKECSIGLRVTLSRAPTDKHNEGTLYLEKTYVGYCPVIPRPAGRPVEAVKVYREHTQRMGEKARWRGVKPKYKNDAYSPLQTVGLMIAMGGSSHTTTLTIADMDENSDSSQSLVYKVIPRDHDH